MNTDKQVTRWFLAIVALAGIIYVLLELTPSSYGFFLDTIQAPDAGPYIGTSRGIRSDEWSVATPLFQAAVRNKFRRTNETSFYREDLRNFIALPLKDWSLVFKPQLWAFFLLPPATAFSLYYALFICGFLAGYHLLFRELGVPAWLAVASSIIVYFSGFTQFLLAPLVAWFPWVLLIVLLPIEWWKKSLLCAWVFPGFVFSQAYPALILTLAWGALIIILAFRPALLRSPGTLVAIAVGGLTAGIAAFVYFADVLPIMRNTVYPGHRISPAGETPVVVALSQLLPFLSFQIGNYRHLTGENICEIGAVASFLPLLTLCLTRYRALLADPRTRRSLLVLLAGFAAFTLWEIAPLPAWIGHLLLWDRGASQRWLFTSGLLLTLAALSIWSHRLISVHALRVTIFVMIGPLASWFIKLAWLIHRGESSATVLSEGLPEMVLCGLALGVGVAVWFFPVASRAPLLLLMLAFLNVYAFGRFNPIQPAGPIFDVPETDVVHALRQQAAAAPGGVLVVPSSGATLNGLGFRSVAHVLMEPQLALFHSYFPAMDAERFNNIFNRFAHIHLTPNSLPGSPRPDVIDVPIEVFVPVRNVRRLVPGPVSSACSLPLGGADQISSSGASLNIDGWAPWASESDAQGIRVLSPRALHLESIATMVRPDVAEQLQDYRFVKAGFQLRISSADGKPLRPEDVVLVAFGTVHGEIRLPSEPCK